jgi:aromatic ring-cleaving dioxygenase
MTDQRHGETEHGVDIAFDGGGLPRSYRDVVNWDAHVYYDLGTDEETRALLVREWIAERFRLTVTKMFQRPLGSHPKPMFVALFDNDQFDVFVPWLMLNRLDLSVLVHPNTTDAYADHVVNGAWLGRQLPLAGTGMARTLAERNLTEVPPVVPNTEPTIALE